MREVFPVVPGEAPDPGRVFYTIRQDDVDKAVIQTEIDTIRVVAVMGRVLRRDVGKRLYRVPTDAGDSWFWQLESQEQYDKRLGIQRPEVKRPVIRTRKDS